MSALTTSFTRHRKNLCPSVGSGRVVEGRGGSWRVRAAATPLRLSLAASFYSWVVSLVFIFSCFLIFSFYSLPVLLSPSASIFYWLIFLTALIFFSFSFVFFFFLFSSLLFPFSFRISLFLFLLFSFVFHFLRVILSLAI